MLAAIIRRLAILLDAPWATMSKFIIHHVGARFGNIPFSIPDDFADCVELVLFDADEDCVAGLVNMKGGNNLHTTLVSACLSDQDKDAEFHITLNPSASSLLQPSEASRELVQPLFGIDWDVADSASIVERRSVTTKRLDTLLLERTDLPPPDFLSLDTQGSELQIIEGACNTIAHTVVGLIVEVEFIELYKNVSRFGEIASLLEKLGFQLARFIDMIDAQASRQPIGCRSDGFPIAADALFLRRVDSIKDRDHGIPEKLAFASIVFGHLDYAFAALGAANPEPDGPDMPRWRSFTQQLCAAAAGCPKIYLPRFPDILPKEAIKRFSQDPDISKWPSLMDLRTWRKTLESTGLDLAHELNVLETPADFPIESILRQHGFTKLADRTNFCRRDQSHKLKQLLAACS